MKTTTKDEIMDNVGAENWQQVVDAYAGKTQAEILADLNVMFPSETDNEDLAADIYAALN